MNQRPPPVPIGGNTVVVGPIIDPTPVTVVRIGQGRHDRMLPARPVTRDVERHLGTKIGR
jgi:hypothetical protein